MTDHSKTTPPAPTEKGVRAKLIEDLRGFEQMLRSDAEDEREDGCNGVADLRERRADEIELAIRLLSAPSGSDLDEGVVARVEAAWEEVRGRLNREHREKIISYRELKAGVNNAALIRDAALSTPSPTLTPDADYDGAALRARSAATVDEDIRRFREAAATPAIRDQAFEEAAKLANQSRAVRLYDETLPDRIRALKGTPPSPDTDRAVAHAAALQAEEDVAPQASPSPDLLKELVEALEDVRTYFQRLSTQTPDDAQEVFNRVNVALLKAQQMGEGE